MGVFLLDSVLLIRANVITPSSDTFCLLRELIELLLVLLLLLLLLLGLVLVLPIVLAATRISFGLTTF